METKTKENVRVRHKSQSGTDNRLEQLVLRRTPSIAKIRSHKRKPKARTSLCSSLLYQKIQYALRSGLATFAPSLLLATGHAPGYMNVFAVVLSLTVMTTSLGASLELYGNLAIAGIYAVPLALTTVYFSQSSYLPRLLGLFFTTFWICRKESLVTITRKFALEVAIVGILATPLGAQQWWELTLNTYLSLLVGGLFALLAQLLPFPKLALREADQRIEYLNNSVDHFFMTLKCCYCEGTEVHHAQLELLSEQMAKQIKELKDLLPAIKWECAMLPGWSLGDHQQLADFLVLISKIHRQAEGMRLSAKEIQLTQTHLAFVEDLEMYYYSTIFEVIEAVDQISNQLRFRRVLHPFQRGRPAPTADAYSLVGTIEEGKTSCSSCLPRCRRCGQEKCICIMDLCKSRWWETFVSRLGCIFSGCKAAFLHSICYRGLRRCFLCTKSKLSRRWDINISNIASLSDSWGKLFLNYQKARRRLLYGLDMSDWDGKDEDYKGVEVEIEKFVLHDQIHGLPVLFARNTFMFDLGNIVKTLQSYGSENKLRVTFCSWTSVIVALIFQAIQPPTLTDCKSFFCDISKMRFPLKVAIVNVMLSYPADRPGLVWGPVTVAFICSKDTSSSFGTGLTRLTGTALGCVYAMSVNDWKNDSVNWVTAVSIAVWCALMSVGRLSKLYGYAAFTSGFTAAVILLGGLSGNTGGIARIDRTITAIFLYLVVDILAWPVSARPLVLTCLGNAISTISDCLNGIQDIISPSSLHSNAQSGPTAQANLGAMSTRLKLEIEEGKRMLALAASEPELWRAPFHASLYLKVINAQESVHQYLDLLMRACSNLPLGESSSLLTSNHQAVVLSIERMVLDVQHALCEANGIITSLRPEAPYQTRKNFAKGIEFTQQKAAALLLLKELVKNLDEICKNETVSHLRERFHHSPILSDTLLLSYNAIIFSLQQVQQSFLELGYAMWGMVERLQQENPVFI